MLPRLHVATVGLQHPAVGAGLRENFANQIQIQSQGTGEAQTFGQPCRIDVHHHVDQRLDLSRFASRAAIPEVHRHQLQQRLKLFKGLLAATTHEVQRPLTGLRDRAGHTAFHRVGARRFSRFFHFLLQTRAQRRAVDEGFARRIDQQVVFSRKENAAHRRIIRHHREHHISRRRHIGQLRHGRRPQLSGHFLRHRRVDVVDCRNLITNFLETTGHVRSHTADADEGNAFFTHVAKRFTKLNDVSEMIKQCRRTTAATRWKLMPNGPVGPCKDTIALSKQIADCRIATHRYSPTSGERTSPNLDIWKGG